MTDKTLGKLKKRVLGALSEYVAAEDEVELCDGDRSLILSRIPDAAASALARMYESLDVGRKTSLGCIYGKKCIFYHPQRLDKSAEAEFDADFTSLGIYFKYCGSGSINIYGGDGNAAVISVSGDERVREMKCFTELTSGGRIRVMPENGIKIFGFTVYENDGSYPSQALCENTEDSFSLPPGFGTLISAECEFGEIDKSLVRTDSGFGFAPGFLTRGAETVALEYKKMPEEITENTPDELSFEMSSLAFDALVYLTAAELCREREADLYTRLVYKYNDLAEVLMRRYEKGRRNCFYRGRARRGL